MGGPAQRLLGVFSQLLLLSGLCVPSLAALEPIGAAGACSEGHVYRITCFTDSAGYIADVQYSSTVRNTPVSLCSAQDWQLQAAQLQTHELSATETFVSFRACSSTAGGLWGLAFVTSLGAELTCGSGGGSSCRSFSSRSTYPLRGMQAACQTQSTGRVRGDAAQAVATRVSSITAACWTPRRQPYSSECPPGQGVRGGGLPCQLCPVSQFSPGGSSPCKPCPAGTTTLAAGQSKCGCFPGQGVYGPVRQDPQVCEECPGGTYSQGGALAPCQPCSTNAFDYLTSAPGSRSIADCVCAAGYGVTPSAPTTCSLCRDGYFNEGPLSPSDPAAALQAFPAGDSSKAPERPPAPAALLREKAANVAAAPAAAPPPAPEPSRWPVVQLPPSPHGLSGAAHELGRTASSGAARSLPFQKAHQLVDLDAAAAAVFHPPFVQGAVDLDAAAAAVFRHPAMQPPALPPAPLAPPLRSSVVVPFAGAGAAAMQHTPQQRGDAGAAGAVTASPPSAVAPAWVSAPKPADLSPATAMPAAVDVQQRSLQQLGGAGTVASATAWPPAPPAKEGPVLSPDGDHLLAATTAADGLQQHQVAGPAGSTPVWPPSATAGVPVVSLAGDSQGAATTAADGLQQHGEAGPAGLTPVWPPSAPAVTPALSWKQRSLQQVNRVFFQPTYNLCTFCGRGCGTGGPGATSPEQCDCKTIEPEPPAPRPTPPPRPPPPPIGQSPVPAPPPPPPSPGPTPPPPPPSPEVEYCIFCNVETIRALLAVQCPTDSVPPTSIRLFNPEAAAGPGDLPCYKLAEFPSTTVTAWTMLTTDQGAQVNFLNAAGWVDCTTAKANQGDAVLEFVGTAPIEDGEAACLMPSIYEFVVFIPASPAPRAGPALPRPAPVPRQSPRTRRPRRSRRGHVGRRRSNHTVLQEPPWPYALQPHNGGY